MTRILYSHSSHHDAPEKCGSDYTADVLARVRVLVALPVLLAAPGAWAEGTETDRQIAETLFEQGRALMEQKKYAEGIAKLTPLADSLTEGASAQGLIATGYEEQGKYKEAAEHFMKAADASAFDADKANFKASAARAYMRAGDGAAAKKLWTELAADPNGPAAGEARVRLGELSAAPVAKS